MIDLQKQQANAILKNCIDEGRKPTDEEMIKLERLTREKEQENG